MAENSTEELYRSYPIPRDSRSIRLLWVAGASTSESDGGPVKTDLEVVNLEERYDFRYMALSYTWGAPDNENFVILCGTTTITVTKNCYSALRHIRQEMAQEEDRSLAIWIDAICINQSDQREKEHQIPMMDFIYSKACIVWVWLGEGTEATDRAMDYLDDPPFLEYCDPEYADKVGDFQPRPWAATWYYVMSGFKTWRRMFPRFEKNDPFKDHEATFEDLNEVLGREWFKRMWTYQEILLASSPVLICGDRSVLWNTFARTIIFLENCGVNYTGYALDGTLDPDKLGTIHDLQSSYALVFSRDNLMALGERNSAQQSQGGAVQLADSAEQSTDLRSYESFIQSITPKYRKLRRRFSWLRYIMCFLAALMIATVGTTAAMNQSRRAANRDAALMSSVVDEILSRPSSTSRATSTPTPGPTSTRAPSASVTATIFTSATRTLLGLQATITPSSIPASFSLDSAKSEYIESCSSSCLARVTAPMSTCLHSCVHEYNPENEKPPFPTVTIVLPSIFLAVFIGLTIFFCCVTMNETAGYKLKSRGRVITWNGKMPSESPRREDIGQNVIAALRSRNATHNADKAFAVQPILRRLADIEIPAPDYSLELKEIYKGLTIQVIQSTGSLEPLLLAAQHRFPQFLSWVPDWSAEFETFWNRQTDARNGNFKASLDSKPSWHVNPENDSLTVRGRRICAITDCVEFQETQNVYLPEEKQVHLENLRKLLQLEFSRTEIAYLAWELKFEQRANAEYEATNWCYRLSSYMKRDIEKQGLEKWFQKIEKSVLRGYKLCEELDVDPEDLHFDHWRKSHTFTNNSAGYADYDFFQTHIYMCNVLARNKRQIFITDKIDPYRGKDSRPGVYSFPWSNEASRKEFLEKMAERGSRPYAGISRFEVKIGDELILIAGLHLPLVVRVEGDSRRLVSPAIVAFMMEGEFWNSALEESGLDEFRLC